MEPTQPEEEKLVPTQEGAPQVPPKQQAKGAVPPVQKQEESEPVLTLTFTKSEITKILTLIEASEEFRLATTLELNTTLTSIHKALYEWYTSTE